MHRSKLRSALAALATSALLMGASAPARAGIPVIDVASIIQAMLDVLNGIAQVENQYQQIVGMGQQIESISKARSLGDVLNNPLLQNYVPRDAGNLVRSLDTDHTLSRTDVMTIFRSVENGGVNATEMTDALCHAAATKRPVFTIVTHSFEMMSRDRKRANRTVMKRFDAMCAAVSRHPDLVSSGFSNLGLTPATTPPARLGPRYGRTARRVAEQAFATLAYERR